MIGFEPAIIDGSACQDVEIMFGVKVVGGGYDVGLKFIPQLKIKPLSEPKLSIIFKVQSPFISQPIKPVKGNAEA